MRDVMASLMRHPALEKAQAELARTDHQTIELQASLSAIPAPTGAEQARGLEVAGRMRRFGLASVSTDAVGNVVGWWGRSAAAPAVVVIAHLDTVFGPDVDVTVRRQGRRLTGPGIADNARGLAGMLALGRIIAEGTWETAKPIAFVATVGEEGAGDLRGAKQDRKSVV